MNARKVLPHKKKSRWEGPLWFVLAVIASTVALMCIPYESEQPADLGYRMTCWVIPHDMKYCWDSETINCYIMSPAGVLIDTTCVRIEGMSND